MARSAREILADAAVREAAAEAAAEYPPELGVTASSLIRGWSSVLPRLRRTRIRKHYAALVARYERLVQAVRAPRRVDSRQPHNAQTADGMAVLRSNRM